MIFCSVVFNDLIKEKLKSFRGSGDKVGADCMNMVKAIKVNVATAYDIKTVWFKFDHIQNIEFMDIGRMMWINEGIDVFRSS